MEYFFKEVEHLFKETECIFQKIERNCFSIYQ